MESHKATRRGPVAATYSRRLPFYDSDEGMALLQQLAQRRGVKAAALLRMLVREEARREGISPPAAADSVPTAAGGQVDHSRTRDQREEPANGVPEPEAAERQEKLS